MSYLASLRSATQVFKHCDWLKLMSMSVETEMVKVLNHTYIYLNLHKLGESYSGRCSTIYDLCNQLEGTHMPGISCSVFYLLRVILQMTEWASLSLREKVFMNFSLLKATQFATL